MIFGRTGFPARSNLLFSRKTEDQKTFFTDDPYSKLELIRIVSEKAVARSMILKDFMIRNDINDISFQYKFFPKNLLETIYSEQKGFSARFVEDSIQGLPMERDAFQMLETIYRNYHSDIKRSESDCSFFPKIFDFIPNDDEIDILLRRANLESQNPSEHPGWYLISATFSEQRIDQINESLRNRVPLSVLPHIPSPTELLDSLLENPFLPGRKEFFPFSGDKQKLKKLIFEKGVIQSSLMKNFLLGNRLQNIQFRFNFQSPEDLSYMLGANEFSVELAGNMIDEPHLYRSFLLRKIENFYAGNTDKIEETIKYFASEGRSFEIHILGLMEMFENREDSIEVLSAHLPENHVNDRGFYVVAVSFVLEFDPLQIESDSEVSKMKYYFPYSLSPRMFSFRGNKDALVQKIQSEGLSQSRVFRNFLEKNEVQDIEFQYCFIPESLLKEILPCGTEYCSSVYKLILGKLNKKERSFLRKEFYYNYSFDILKYVGSENRKSCNSKCRIFHPTIIEMLKKDVSSAALFSSCYKNLAPERGVYLISAFFIPTDKKRVLPPRPELEVVPSCWSDDAFHVTFMGRVFSEKSEEAFPLDEP
jgi:hypothetical protein